MDVLGLFLDFVLGAAFWAGVIVVIAVLVRLAGFVRRRRAAQRAADTPTPEPLSWYLTLLVGVDEEAGLFRPSIQLQGTPALWPASVRLELVDQHGLIRCSSQRPLPLRTIGTELPLPPFRPPDGAGVHEALRWHWDVVIADERRERARWREHPAPAGPLNAEAELELPAVAPFSGA